MALDSWVHAMPNDISQLPMLNLFLEQNVQNKIAMYHGSLYPCRILESYLQGITSSMFQNWQPLFDKYNLKIAIEGHNGCYKVTKPLKNGQGIVFIMSWFHTLFVSYFYWWYSVYWRWSNGSVTKYRE